jgi:hypothetical protein
MAYRAVIARLRRRLHTALLGGVMLLTSTSGAQAFSYLFAEGQGASTVTHPRGYTGTGGNFALTIGIDPASLFASEMVISTQNVIQIWNELQPTVGNVLTLGEIGKFDFESVLLHELAHALGLEHPNLGSESGFADGRTEYTRTSRGSNGAYDLNAGPDGVPGSSDDQRGDDVNLNWFAIGSNNPFQVSAVIDSSTYSLLPSQLPSGHTSSANASRQVAAITPGVLANTEAVMQQGTFLNEAQRTLGHDDVAGIRYAMAGVDGIAGTSDDYTFRINYAGLTTAADVTIKFDNSQTSFAVTKYTASRIGTTSHLTLDTSQIYLNSTQPWHFNQTPIPEPASGALLLGAVGWLLSHRRREKASPRQPA